jgi:hypothetical protein
MLNIAIGHGMDAHPVGRDRAETARPTDGVVAGTPGSVVAGTTTGAVALAGVVAGTPGTDADPVGRYKVEDARPTDLEGQAGRELTCER